MDNILDKCLQSVELINKHLMESSSKFKCIVNASEKIYNTRKANMKKAILVSMNEDESSEVDQLKHKIPQLMCTVSNWWDIFVQDRYPEQSCLEFFRCSRKTYIYLITVLRPHIQPKVGIAAERQSLNMIKGVSVEKQVAILLYKLSRSGDYASISSMFGIHKSTVHKSLYKTIMAINKQLLYKNIYMPQAAEAEEIAKMFEEKCKIPQVIGVMQSLHIPIITTQNVVKTFNNSAGYGSAIMQCVVDSKCLFRDLSIRHPGSADQHSILEDSKLYQKFDRVIPKETRNINGVDISYKICTDCSYPLLSWILPSYITITKQGELIFNECINEATNFVYEAFNRLKSRFSILSHAIDISYKITPQIIGACCIIHNICEQSGDAFLDEWRDDMLLERYPQPEKIVDESEPSKADIQQREAIREYLESIVYLQEPVYIDQEDIDLLTEEIK